MDKLLKWFAMAVTLYFVAVSIYNITQNSSQASLVNNGLVAALGGWLLYYLSR